MKLLYINVCLNWGSTGRIVEQCGLMMKQRGWDVYCACGARYNRKSELDVIKTGSVADVLVHKLQSALFDTEGLGSVIATKRLVRKIQKINPDVIHLHNIHGHYINYRILFDYLKSSGKPVLWTLHDCWAFTGHCSHFLKANCEKWETGCHNCPLKKDYPSSWLFDRSGKNWNEKKNAFSSYDNLTIVPVSHWLEGLVLESFLNVHPVKVIQNGIDLNIFKPQEESRVNSKFTVLGVANVWTKDKGLAEFEMLSNNPDFEVIMVGGKPGDEKHLPALAKHVSKLDNQRELAELYSRADVFVNPTYADTFPTVNLEAIACGTPVVTYRTGGSPESVPPEVGRVVETGDVKSLVDAIYELRRNPIPRDVCRKYAEAHFDKDNCFAEYIKLYESLV